MYSYFQIGLKATVVSCLTNPIAPLPFALELFKGSNGSVSLLVCSRKKFFGWGLCIFVSDVISEVVFGPFWLMLPGLGPNR